MEMEDKVRVHGMWACIYSKRVEMALKMKGIPYEHVEEDLANKSQAVIDGNPVYKKIPVFFHNGKPVCESMVILEYIDEAWPNHTPRLLPQDPYDRAQVRFWAGFLSQLVEDILKLIKCEGESLEKALKELHEKMSVVEKDMKDFIPNDFSNIENDNIGLLDIQLNSVFGGYRAAEEVTGMKILDPQKHPLLFSWVNALLNLPVVKETAPNHDMLVAFLRMYAKLYPSA